MVQYIVLMTSYVFLLSFILQLNENVSAFQRKYVNDVRKCDEMERKLRELLFALSFVFLSLMRCEISSDILAIFHCSGPVHFVQNLKLSWVWVEK